MSQIIGFLDDNFAIIASDSNIADENGVSIASSEKLFVGDNFIITSAGLSFGIEIIRGFISHSGVLDLITKEEIENYLVTYGSKQLENFFKNYGKMINERLKRLYFLFAAFDKEKKLSLGFLGTEGTAPLANFTIGNIITAPRRIVLETKLVKLLGKTKNEIENFILEHMKKISQQDSAVKSPFIIAILDKSGNVSVTRYS